LIKVMPVEASSALESPRSTSSAEQWKLTKAISGREICTLGANDTYWGR